LSEENIILGAGVTGLAAGVVSGWPIYEAEENPGGICSSYYMRPGDPRRYHDPPEDGEAYRFEIGGGHWIHSRDPMVLQFMQSMIKLKMYNRISAVYFPDKNVFIPYPIQNNLFYLGSKLAAKALKEMIEGHICKAPVETLADWLLSTFGPTLCDLFFYPFHELYTGGLFKSIAPQDSYKSPVNLPMAIQGAFEETSPLGYNVIFYYPLNGLNALSKRMAAASKVHYGKRVVEINVQSKELIFEDGSTIRYSKVISTLPLKRVIELSNINIPSKPDPYTSTLVLNIAAYKGRACPKEHWLYIPRSKAGFHRVGLYSNVDSSFLPASVDKDNDLVSIYVEKAYQENYKPTISDICTYTDNVVKELMEWEWIKQTEIIDHTWIEISYCWSWPGSTWKQEAITTLREHNIFQVGRFARWENQGISDSITEGLIAGGALRKR